MIKKIFSNIDNIIKAIKKKKIFKKKIIKKKNINKMFKKVMLRVKSTNPKDFLIRKVRQFNQKIYLVFQKIINEIN